MRYPIYLIIYDTDNVACVEEPYLDDFIAENLDYTPEVLVRLTDHRTAEVLNAEATWQEMRDSWDADRRHQRSFKNPGV